MSFARPTRQQLIDRIRNDIIARMNEDDELRRSDIDVYAKVMAICSDTLFGFLADVADQVIYDTADKEHLLRWASIWLEDPFIEASYATGTGADGVLFTTSVGAFIPAGTLVKAFDGIEYATLIDGTAIASALLLDVRAVVAGSAGNRTTGQTVNLVSPVSGVQTSALAGEISGGADDEDETSILARLLDRIRNPPHGGTDFDYVRWAKEVAGVTRAWCYENWAGSGTVLVLFVRDDDVSIIPDAGEIATVDAYLRDDRKPVGCTLTTGAPIASPLNYVISITPDTPAIRAAVQAEIADLHRREAEPAGTLLISHIRAAISSAAGEQNYVMSSPSADVTASSGHISTVGTFTW